ncbi:MAG: D-glycero-beta-D-manno-heptose 1,7-bisphosphate 7-phosphatase [Legionellaceae bacterium]|nr:D-glycero-beta-D-manno-heptose 1,7-bisphosphate 7-phosphatase [Legionellaceae bacterium]
MQLTAPSKVIILDRDGIINQDSVNYIRSADEFIFLPGSVDAVARLTIAGYKIGLATNQSGIARGYYDESTLSKIHNKMQTAITDAGGEISEIAFCPHLPSAGCECRKPRPGMLLDLAGRFGCSPADIIFVGDKITDIQAAIAVGATPMLVYSPMTDKTKLDDFSPLSAFDSLAECADFIINT